MTSISLNQFIIEEQLQFHHATDEAADEFALLLNNIVMACKKISVEVNKGALTGTMGNLQSENVQGEVQKELDVITNEIFLEYNMHGGYFAGMVSEELDEPYIIPELQREAGRYLLLFDPLDGSSNVNINISVGSIFSIVRNPQGLATPHFQDFLQPGTQQVCAGYALYGSSTMLVLTTGNGVNGFTLDREVGEFFLTHPNMRIPEDTQEFAINMSNQRFWEPPMQRYIAECLQGKDGPRGKDFNMRWIASMATEVHRILVRGGIFTYPIDSKLKQKGGRLRLMYEANPMSFIVEQAGGASSTGHERIMAIQPHALHQRVPVILGAKNEVERLVAYHQN
ncbi:MAG TPA: class 1 fructose-bisphosphatase [Methylophilaceae bacterium]|nr:class 1 fructose-bisphosphatase [Methylophilaceae bacterium]